MLSVAVILVGPGRYGFDAGRGWARRPFIGSFAALVVGIGAGVGAVDVAQRREPGALVRVRVGDSAGAGLGQLRQRGESDRG